MIRALILLSAFFSACSSEGNRIIPDTTTLVAQDTSFLHYVNGNRYSWLRERTDTHCLRLRFPPPPGTKRLPVRSGDWGDWLRHLPLHPGKPDVLLFNGQKKGNQDVHEAVTYIDVGNSDLQQCADAVMRLRAEYFYSKEMFDSIHFRYTSGHEVTFKDWASGIRPFVTGNKVLFKGGNRKGTDRENFSQYLKNVFTYAGTLSLSKEMKSVATDSIQPGDVFIVGGSPGHAVLVLDVAVDVTGSKYFMLGQSYMPAQQIHVLKNLNDPDISPWYSVKEIRGTLKTPEWNFSGGDLKRF